MVPRRRRGFRADSKSSSPRATPSPRQRPSISTSSSSAAATAVRLPQRASPARHGRGQENQRLRARARPRIPAGHVPTTACPILPATCGFPTEGASCARGEREGLFDVRIGADVSAVVANGLGGGSLINAGVMAEPATEVFTRPRMAGRDPRTSWPDSRDKNASRTCELLLGAAPTRWKKSRPVDKARVDNTVDKAKHSRQSSTCCGAWRTNRVAKPFRAAPITVALTDKRTSSARRRARQLPSLRRLRDRLQPWRQGFARRQSAPHGGTGGCFDLYRRDGAAALAALSPRGRASPAPCARPMRGSSRSSIPMPICVRGKAASFRLVARKVILAAGTFGSTEILLRSRSDDLVFSCAARAALLTNGDMIAVAYDQSDRQATRLSSSTQSPTNDDPPRPAQRRPDNHRHHRPSRNERDAGRHRGDGGSRSVAPRVRRGRHDGSYAARACARRP